MGCFLWELSLTLVFLFSVDVDFMSGLKLLFLPGPEKKNRVSLLFSSLEDCCLVSCYAEYLGSVLFPAEIYLSWVLLRRVVFIFISIYLYIRALG